jgi:DNA-binding CsgD family transcriptional regulator
MGSFTLEGAMSTPAERPFFRFDDLESEVRQVAADDGWQAAAAVVEARWDELAATEPAQLLAAVKALPGEAFMRNPGLLIAANHLEHVAVGGRPTRVHATMEHTQSAFMGSPTLDRLIALTSDSAAARTRDDPMRAAQIAEQALAELDAVSAAEATRIAKSLAHLRMQWARSLDAADSPRARVEYERTYEVATATEQLRVARRAASHAAWLHAERGRLDVAARWVARATGVGVTDERYDAALHVTEALIRIDRDDLAGAKALLDQADEVGLGEYWAAALWVRSVHAHNVADAAVVETLLANHAQEHPGVLEASGFNGRLARACRVRVLLLRGRVAENLDSLAALSDSDQVIAAAIAHVERREHDAMRLSRRVTEDGVEPRLQSNALLVHAAAALALGYTDTAAHAFLRADALIQHAGLHTGYESIAPDDLQRLIDLSGSDTQAAIRIGSARRDLPNLTPRENDVLALLTTELTAGEIASTLFISSNTLKTMTQRLYRKLEVTSRREAVDYAHRAGFPNGGSSS